MRVGRCGRDAVPLGIRAFVRLERRHPRVQDERSHADALRDEARDELGRERTPRARHLRTARLARVHVLIGVERPVPRDVPVANRPSVYREIGEQRRGKVERANPHACRSIEARRQVHEATGDQLQRAPRRFVEPRLGRAAVRTAQLDQPQVGRQPLREVNDEGRAVFAHRVERRRECPRGVDHNEVAFVEEGRKVVRVRVHEPQITSVRHHHPDGVTRDAPCFRRLGRLPHHDFRRRRRGHDRTSASSLAR